MPIYTPPLNEYIMKGIYWPYWPQHKPVVYHLGEWYRYYGSDTLFRLKAVQSDIFVFDCGHWCTDTVMRGMIRVSTGVSVYKEPIDQDRPQPQAVTACKKLGQLKLF
jgi:hypothetical protein